MERKEKKIFCVIPIQKSIMANRATNWTVEEIKTLIDIWGEEDVQKIMSSTKKNTLAYEKIHLRMLDAGYRRTKDQVQVSLCICF